MKNGRLSVYKIYMYFHKKSKKIIKYKKKEKLSGKWLYHLMMTLLLALPPNDDLTVGEITSWAGGFVKEGSKSTSG